MLFFIPCSNIRIKFPRTITRTKFDNLLQCRVGDKVFSDTHGIGYIVFAQIFSHRIPQRPFLVAFGKEMKWCTGNEFERINEQS